MLVEHKTLKTRYALKLAVKMKLKQMRKEQDLINEKLALTKMRERASALKEEFRFVELVTTFSDEMNVYILLENLQGMKKGSTD